MDPFFIINLLANFVNTYNFCVVFGIILFIIETTILGFIYFKDYDSNTGSNLIMQNINTFNNNKKNSKLRKFFYTYISEENTDFIFDFLSNVFRICGYICKFIGYQIPKSLNIPYINIMILFIIMYIIYLVIVIIIPQTGFATLFIPIRELLLAIPPLPQLSDRGVFRFFEKLINFFIPNGSFNDKFKDFFISYFDDMKYSVIEMLRLFNPDIDITIEEMNNNNKKSEIDNINNDVEVCINSNTEFTTPNTNYFTMLINDFKNTKYYIKCNLKNINSYVSTEEP